MKPWVHWDTRELFRIQDLCLTAIDNGRPLVDDWLDALPPPRAMILLRIAAATPGPVTDETVEVAKEKACDKGSGAGPGWLTGRQGRTCVDCGHTTWPTAGHHGFGHIGPCQTPGAPGLRHPVSREMYVAHNYGLYGEVLMPESLARYVATQDT